MSHPNWVYNTISNFMRLTLLLCASLLLISCTKTLTERKQVYFNDFEQGKFYGIEVSDRTGAIDNNQVTVYKGNKVMGPFHNGTYVQFALNSLPEHNRLKIEFDLYIHDNWRGNEIPQGFDLPDYWVLEVDGSYPIFTTFANVTGQFQSFPENYEAGRNPFPARGNSWAVNLPGVCAQGSSEYGTTLYKVDLFHFHTHGQVRIAFTDQMRQTLPLCEKSWSIDNVRISALEFR